MVKAQLRLLAVAGLELAIEQLRNAGHKPHGEIIESLNRIKNPPTGIFQEEVMCVEAWWKFRCPDCGEPKDGASYLMHDDAVSAARRHEIQCPAKVTA